jgi:HSP20 family protein
MSLIPWKGKSRQNGGMAIAPVDQFRLEMNQLFDSFFREPLWSTNETFGGLSAWSPPLDVAETDKGVTFRAEIPGVDPKDLNITVEGNRLVISGEKKETSEKKEQSFHRRETYNGRFTRQVELPQSVDPVHVEANYNGGVLTVQLKKSAEAVPKKIPVKSS